MTKEMNKILSATIIIALVIVLILWNIYMDPHKSKSNFFDVTTTTSTITSTNPLFTAQELPIKDRIFLLPILKQ